MFENLDLYEVIGFVASLFIAISLTMSSIIKLRWYNLAGASIFSVYGFLIDSVPVAWLNLFICGVNIYYLVQLYSKKEHFKALMVRPDNFYLDFFLEYHKEEIVKFFPDFPNQKEFLKKETERPFAVIILRNAAVAGVILGKKTSAHELFIILDFVIPEFRDLKPGQFMFHKNTDFFKKNSITTISTIPKNKSHFNYLKKLGFQEQPDERENVYLVKNII